MMSSVNEEESDRKGAIKVGFGAGLVAGCAPVSYTHLRAHET